MRILQAVGTERVVMNTNNVVAQEDWAFDKLDELLDKAVWKKGAVILKPQKNTIYCYSVEMLRNQLLSIAAAVVKQKFKQCDATLDDVVDNILEEYSQECREFILIKYPKKKVS